MATTVVFTPLYLHDAADLSSFDSWGVGGITEVKEASGSVTAFANGRLRAVTGPSKARTYQVSLPYIDRSTLTALDSYLNKPVLLRGPRGRVVYGQFFDYNITEGMLPGQTPSGIPVEAATFTFHEISMSEEV